MSLAPTDLSTLAPPTVAVPSRDVVRQQRIRVPLTWWNTELARRGLPGGPLTTTERTLTREEVWRFAAAAEDDEAALRLLWHALAWGAGSRLRMCAVRLDAVAEDITAAGQVLSKAAQAARTDPAAAYDTLHPRGGSAIRGLGPSFGTKFLYFAGGGDHRHPCAILDSYVAGALHRHGWKSLRSGRWPAWTYQRYCDLLSRWADELSDRGDDVVAPDQIEYWLFGDR